MVHGTRTMPVDAVLAPASCNATPGISAVQHTVDRTRMYAALAAATLTTILLSGYMVAVG